MRPVRVALQFGQYHIYTDKSVAHMTARYDQLGATANELAEAQARLQGTCQRYKAVNTQLQKKLKIGKF